MSDESVIAQEGYDTTVQVQHLLLAVRGLLALVGDLKQQLLLHDSEAIRQYQVTAKDSLQEVCRETCDTLAELRDAVAAHLHAVETAYYLSSALPLSPAPQ